MDNRQKLLEAVADRAWAFLLVLETEYTGDEYWQARNALFTAVAHVRHGDPNNPKYVINAASYQEIKDKLQQAEERIRELESERT